MRQGGGAVDLGEIGRLDGVQAGGFLGRFEPRANVAFSRQGEHRDESGLGALQHARVGILDGKRQEGVVDEGQLLRHGDLGEGYRCARGHEVGKRRRERDVEPLLAGKLERQTGRGQVAIDGCAESKQDDSVTRHRFRNLRALELAGADALAGFRALAQA